MSGYEALDGIKILSLTQFFLGPSAVQYLADMGAEVVKVESIQGAYERRWSGGNLFLDGQSMFYMLGNRRAKSVGLDLKNERAQRIGLALAREADIVVQNFRPGVVDRLGLGYESVRAVNPSVIYASASGYGDHGAYRNLPGQDLLLQAMTGLASVSGSAEGPPTPVGCSVVDQHAASLLATGILGALFRRERTGQGEHVQIAMARAALNLQLESVSYHINGFPVERGANGLASGYHQAPYGIYPTAQGHIAISLSPIAQVAEATGSSDLAAFSEADAWSQKKAIAALLTSILSRKNAAEWEQVLRDNGVWAQRVNSYDEAVSDPAILSLEPFETVTDAHGNEVKFVKGPLQFSGKQAASQGWPARLGEHTRQILNELGYEDSEVDRLADEGIVGLGDRG